MRHVTKYHLSEDCGRQNNLNGHCGNCSAARRAGYAFGSNPLYEMLLRQPSCFSANTFDAHRCSATGTTKRKRRNAPAISGAGGRPLCHQPAGHGGLDPKRSIPLLSLFAAVLEWRLKVASVNFEVRFPFDELWQGHGLHFK